MSSELEDKREQGGRKRKQRERLRKVTDRRADKEEGVLRKSSGICEKTRHCECVKKESSKTSVVCLGKFYALIRSRFHLLSRQLQSAAAPLWSGFLECYKWRSLFSSPAIPFIHRPQILTHDLWLRVIFGNAQLTSASILLYTLVAKLIFGRI